MYNFSKRVFDIIVSGISILILLPLFIPIVIGLKLTGEGEIWYRQKRIGLNSQYFHILKFATMLKDSPNMGSGMITLRNDPRVTPLGRFLRKSKINELPQIFNVLKGEMSIVGPRPTVEKHANAYTDVVRDIIYSNKPGITGIGSIIFRDEEELISNSNLEPFEFYKSVIIPYKTEVELWYNENKSFIQDLKIVWATAWVILFPKSKIVTSWFPSLPKREF